MLVLYPIGLLLWGAFKLAGFAGFYLAGLCFKGKNKKRCYSFQFVRSWLSQEAASLPHINSWFRTMLFRLSGIRIVKNCFIGKGGIPEDLYPERIIIEDNTTVSFGVTFVAHGLGENNGKTAVLRHHAYVGARATLLPGVEIGSYAVVGAGSVVTKDVLQAQLLQDLLPVLSAIKLAMNQKNKERPPGNRWFFISTCI